MFLDGGRKLERNHGENMPTPHRKNQLGFEPGTLLIRTIHHLPLLHKHKQENRIKTQKIHVS